MRLKLHPGGVPTKRSIAAGFAVTAASAVAGVWLVTQAVEQAIEAVAGDED